MPLTASMTTVKFLDQGLKSLRVQPIPFLMAKQLIECHYYSHSIPGGTMLTFGVFLNSQLLGAITFGVGPFDVYSLVEGARSDDCLTLTRLLLSDELLGNSESRVIGIVLRALKQHTNLKFIVTYADTSSGHTGIIYRATNWTFARMSSSTPLYDLGDGKPKHSVVSVMSWVLTL